MPKTVTIETADGRCEARLFTPQGDGPWPGVVFFMDGFAIRPALFDMAQRLADLTGLRVAPAANTETTALGAALFAGIGSGLFSGPEEAAEVAASAAVLKPALDEAARKARHDRWLEAVARVRSQG
jgi:glycerol kinase